MNTLSLTPGPAKLVRSKDWVNFHCLKCGQCCRDLENVVMVESLDAYRIARYLREHGQPDMEMALFYERYTSPMLLVEGYPVMMMNAPGPDHACAFLDNNRCSIYPARPRACRQYPFSVGPGSRGKDFEWYLSLDRPFHLTGGKVLVKDWIYQNFPHEEREFLLREYDASIQIAKCLKAMDDVAREQCLKQIIYFRYIFYDLDDPFLPQYDRNLRALLQQLG